MNPKWYFFADGREHGPFTAQVLMQLAKDKKITPKMRIRKNDGDWISASDVQGLFDVSPPRLKSIPPLPESPADSRKRSRYRILVPVVVGLVLYGFGFLTGVLLSRQQGKPGDEMSKEAKEVADTLRALEEAGIDIETMFSFRTPDISESLPQETDAAIESHPPDGHIPHMTTDEYLTECEGNEAVMEGRWVEIAGIVEEVARSDLGSGYSLSLARLQGEGKVECLFGAHRRDELADLTPGDRCVVVGRGMFVLHDCVSGNGITPFVGDCRITGSPSDPEQP